MNQSCSEELTEKIKLQSGIWFIVYSISNETIISWTKKRNTANSNDEELLYVAELWTYGHSNKVINVPLNDSQTRGLSLSHVARTGISLLFNL